MQRYVWGARWYDLLSGDPVYRAGRRVAIPALGLRAGERVLDLGCGTGLNLPGLCAAVEAEGAVVGVDLSAAMLAVADRRATRAGWRQARFVQADATVLAAADLVPEEASTSPPASVRPFDALLVTYALSLMPDPEAAWRAARALLAPRARVAVVDLARPVGRARWATPLARLACAAGGSDIDARPWQVVADDLVDVRAWELVGGHVQVCVGSRPGTR